MPAKPELGTAGAASPAQPAPGPALAVTMLRGVGPRAAERLARLGLRTVEDVLFHLPYRYEDRTRIVPIGSLRAGDAATVLGTVAASEVRPGRRRSLVCVLDDGTGRLALRFFHFGASQQQLLRRGARLRCYGEARRGPGGLELVHPDCRAVDPDEPVAGEAHLTPVYPATEGLTQGALRAYAHEALAVAARAGRLTEHLPAEVLAPLGLPPLADALAFVHAPPAGTPAEALARAALPAQRRLSFEEILAHHLSLRLVRARMHGERAPVLAGGGRLEARFRAGLGFDLTAAQERAGAEIAADLARGRPMHRLLQGDVGSGKTVVAALAALRALESGHQVALMAPTELLAEQHRRSFAGWLAPLGIAVAGLAGKGPASERRAAREALAAGRAGVAIGTHALFQEEVRFAQLGLVIVDEQHRFGVGQRLALRAKGDRGGEHPHQLVMSATPIPRTLAMTAYADLDTSLIDELPPGRTPVETAVVPRGRREEVIERVHEAARAGQQAYWVCPLVEESDALEAEAAADTARRLAAELPDVRVGLVHGRMRPGEKEAAMRAFAAGTIDLLVATTVIEVGVDVPRASLMVIENAERMGLAQLHQLRGRVGRGAARSACVLLYQGPLSALARERLAVVRRTTDGFAIAERDLELRGPGEVLGTRQAGLAALRIADLRRDRALLPHVAPAAEILLRRHPERIPPLIARWLRAGVEYAAA